MLLLMKALIWAHELNPRYMQDILLLVSPTAVN
jgi:hypothetical protein